MQVAQSTTRALCLSEMHALTACTPWSNMCLEEMRDLNAANEATLLEWIQEMQQADRTATHIMVFAAASTIALLVALAFEALKVPACANQCP